MGHSDGNDDGVRPNERRPSRRTLGRFELLAEVGRGGMGVVYRARDPALGRVVALKVLREGAYASPREVERFRREAALAGGLRHPNIVSVHEVGEVRETALADPVRFIAMDYLPGPTLAERLPELRRRWTDIAGVLEKIARAVHAAHEGGVVHRDLKPGNIIFDERGEPVVTDFGLAKMVGAPDAVTRTGATIGTPIYMAPEQIRDTKKTDARSDVYALGVMLFEMAAGEPPFVGSTVTQTYAKILRDDPPPLAAVPAKLAVICGQAMEKEPARRYATAAQFADDLRRFVEGESLEARPPSVAYRVRRAVARRKALVGTFVGGLAALALGAMIVRGHWRARAEEAARERARAPLDAGRKIVEEMRDRMRDPEHTAPEIGALLDGARREFGRALREHPDHPEALLGLGRACALARLEDEALGHLDRAIAVAPAFAPAYLERVRIDIRRYELARRQPDGTYAEETPESARLRARVERDLGEVERHAEEGKERLYARGILAYTRGEFELAQQLLAEYLAGTPVDPWGHYWRGDALCQLGRHAEGEEALTRAIRAYGRFAAAHLTRGLARAVRGDRKGALEDYERALGLDPDMGAAWNNRGTLRDERGDTDGALADYAEAIARSPRLPMPYYNRGEVRRVRGDVEGALADYNEALRLRPGYAKAYVGRALVHENRGEPDAAVADIEAAIRADPRLADGWMQRGRVRAQRGRLAEAIADYDEAIRLRPAYADAYSNRGLTKRDAGDVPGALADHDEAVRLAPGVPQMWNNRALARRSGGDLRGALDDLATALRLKPEYPRALYNRGDVRAEMGDLGRAIADYTEAIRLDPQYRDAYLNRGIARESSGDARGAAADYTKALEVDPRCMAAWSNRGSLRRELGETDAALADHDEAIRLDPKVPQVWNNRGLTRRAKGDLDGAIADFTEAIRLAPRYANAHHNRGLVRAEKGENAAALDDLQRAAELAPPGWRLWTDNRRLQETVRERLRK